ncbi:GNAT family N-acetyltransferase [Cohnella faecalis]|uniref:GNAT family N-acetyltransferase n=1 Tax=Cohnella faecalis TaxID=2315694 RepID=A0A398CL75_9BACL|nr:GNAT family N-acetyltransferase [Cohnella faecalis]RIE03413.1 GNAT family N-acetyltransferase [Cohnella faecalis]
MNIEVIYAITERFFLDLLKLYEQEEWTNKRNPAGIKKMMEHCTIIGLVDKDNDKLVGFLRVITDFVYRATVYDVIIQSDYQGKGLGRMLMDEVVNHPELKDIERIELYCAPDKIEFYNKWDFYKVSEFTHFMRKTNTI